ncbi:MAG: hypothetical protein MRY83_13495 [Flavobacteriales bacterium]|nr:hypothetical protein [Flavobacteriales bacterium]
MNENDLSEIIWSSIHEVGHALYELGIPDDNRGTPINQYCSMSIHESQSRLYENNLGRSEIFWKNEFHSLQNVFDRQLESVSAFDFYKGINRVRPSLIRTSADEITYHLHILVRFEIERDLIGGRLSTKDAKDAWNEKYEKYLSIVPKHDAEGILQDVHWSQGLFGYFPTYSLGSFYAAQFYAKATEKDNMKSAINSGNYDTLLDWLREHIHKLGRSFNAEELCQNVTGESLNLDYFVNYILAKYSEIYSARLN